MSIDKKVMEAGVALRAADALLVTAGAGMGVILRHQATKPGNQKSAASEDCAPEKGLPVPQQALQPPFPFPDWERDTVIPRRQGTQFRGVLTPCKYLSGEGR